MIVQNQNTAWIVLALIVLCMAVAFGVNLATEISFGPSQDVKDEQVRMNIHATEAALGSIQTPQAVFAGQTAIAAELTALPLVHTATAIEADRRLALVQQAATQTRTGEEAYLNSLAVGATATSIYQSSLKENEMRKSSTSLATIIVVAFFVWMIGQGIKQIIVAHSQEQAARANLLEAQRKLVIERRSRSGQAQSRATHTSAPLPLSLMKKNSKNDNLPRAE